MFKGDAMDSKEQPTQTAGRAQRLRTLVRGFVLESRRQTVVELERRGDDGKTPTERFLEAIEREYTAAGNLA